MSPGEPSRPPRTARRDPLIYAAPLLLLAALLVLAAMAWLGSDRRPPAPDAEAPAAPVIGLSTDPTPHAEPQPEAPAESPR